jgi:hypothetical protein
VVEMDCQIKRDIDNEKAHVRRTAFISWFNKESRALNLPLLMAFFQEKGLQDLKIPVHKKTT